MRLIPQSNFLAWEAQDAIVAAAPEKGDSNLLLIGQEQ